MSSEKTNDKEFGEGQPICRLAANFGRRAVLQGMAAAGGIAMAGQAFAQAADDLPADELPPQVGDFITIREDGRPLEVKDLRPGVSPKTAYAVSPDGLIRNGEFMNTLLAIKFNDADLTDEAKTRAVEGVLVYSAICTHAGCEVTGWLREEKTLECPCHGSHFDPKNNGAVLFGPAGRKLPQLGLEIKDGKIIVASVFDSRIGGDETM
ncbi:ubiquinol-cytochrome c reductase iron-sulfur subunit [Devosia sp. 2618]|uniref:QcrA and Rieske domain-containing protein n=1 Tax=Devosia sp. 2618 TaxID=3156454 RepID=UPI00339A9F9F